MRALNRLRVRSTARLRTLYFGLAVAILIPLGCGNATKPEESVTGEYTLSSINGQPLPYVVVHGLTKYEFMSASLTFLTRGRVADVRCYRLTTGFAGVISYDTLRSTPSYVLKSPQLVLTHNTGALVYADSGTMSASAISLRTNHYDPITADSFTLTYSHTAGK